MTTQSQKLATMHAALVLELTPLAQKVADVLALVEAMGHQINAALVLNDELPAQTFDQLGGSNPNPPETIPREMAVHVPSTVARPPVETNEIGAVVHTAEFAPDASMLRDDNIIDPARGVNVFGEKPKRAKTEYTAKEWAMSPHFLHLMKRQHPFNTWTAEQQNAKRDEFVASVPEGEKMNRWGQRFAKFCGVST